MKRKRWFLIAMAVAAMAALSVPALAATKTVSVKDNVFKAKRVTVAKGGKVKWEWAGANEHDVEFIKVPNGAKKPKRCGTRTSGSCSRTFRKSGVYRYVCTIHLASDGMKGRITVR